MKKYAVIVAGGSGTRMGNPQLKQFLELLGKPLLYYTLSAFLDSFDDLKIILVLPKDCMEAGREVIGLTAFPERIQAIAGGETRFHSVKAGLGLADADSIVFVHDGVRCLPTPDLIRRCYHLALEKGNAIPAIAATDSIRIDKGGRNEAVDRRSVMLVQTPQTFYGALIKAAYSQAVQGEFTDDASVLESTGAKIYLAEGESTNIKITLPIDLLVAAEILRQRYVKNGGQ